MPSAMTSHPREVARAAAQWLALLDSGSATDADHQRLQQWRNSHASHEHTWQRAQALRQRFTALPSELALATLDRPDLARRAALKRALGVAALIPSAWLISRQLPLEVWSADLHTATGEQKTVRLADGSQLQLNTDSAVNVNLSERTLTLLRGEIALKASGNAALTLALPYGQVHVQHSEVCVRRFERSCQVAVASGEVRLQPLHGQALLLREGQQVNLQADGAGPIEAFEAALPGWRQGVLLADNQPLGDFLRELSRFRSGWLRWSPTLENLRVTGSFRVNDTDQVLALLAASLPLAVVSRTRYWVTLVPNSKMA